MNKEDLFLIIKNKVNEYGSMPYSSLVKKVESLEPDTYEDGAFGSDDFYQIEIQVVFDDLEYRRNLRVLGSIDDGKNLKGSYDAIVSPDGVLGEGGKVWYRRSSFFSLALSLFFLRTLLFSLFAFPRWHTVLAVTLIGVLVGLDPQLRAGTPAMPGLPLWLAIPSMVLSVWVAFLVIVAVLRWWMKRGSRWDGQGDLFNLVAASWLVANILGAGLTALGVPYMLTLPLWLYSVWVGANALSGAIPKASLRYSIGGIVIGLVPAIVASGMVFALAGILMATLGLAPSPTVA